jgi:hypothetical protein
MQSAFQIQQTQTSSKSGIELLRYRYLAAVRFTLCHIAKSKIFIAHNTPAPQKNQPSKLKYGNNISR